ncbi:hypothetical protein P4571_08605 [Niallia alba]|uniref:hypothetical protein n=1 Tax=Niallia alba TaxID=2729105 RepID=UPI002E213DEF|nr:hypothetical protein [Niallia alba]
MKKSNIDNLKIMLSEIKNAYYGGFRATQDEEEIESLEWAISKLESIKEHYPELFLD